MIVLDIAIFATADANWPLGIDKYIDAANYHLSNFDMRLNVYPARPANPVGISLVGQVHDRPSDFGLVLLPGHLRAAAAVALPSPHGMPVIFCKFFRSDAGLTQYQEDLGANLGVPWLNYVLVNSEVLNADRGVLLHELIHAANYSGNQSSGTIMFGRTQHDIEQDSIMRPNPVPNVPVTMFERHAAKLRVAYFARTV
jgi:hypothetical protein